VACVAVVLVRGSIDSGCSATSTRPFAGDPHHDGSVDERESKPWTGKPCPGLLQQLSMNARIRHTLPAIDDHIAEVRVTAGTQDIKRAADDHKLNEDEVHALLMYSWHQTT
jgi:hypothetical protein